MGRKGKGKGKNNMSVEGEIMTCDKNYHEMLAERIVSVCEKENLTIFGGYVREYLSSKNFDYMNSDIDIYSRKISLEKFFSLLLKQGIRVRKNELHETGQKYMLEEDRNGAIKFKVNHLVVGFINDELFLGEKIEIKIDFVQNDGKLGPPFNNLDFESNAFIWDKHGIRLSRETGTDIDTLSARDIKKKETEILFDSSKNLTKYFSLKFGISKTMSSTMRFMRKCRIIRIVKTLKKGWKIINFDSLCFDLVDDETFCIICHEKLTGECLKMSCCQTHFHEECFINYSKSELDDHTFIKCPQRCGEIEI